MTHFKPLINVGCNDEDYYMRKRKISYVEEISQGKHRYRKVYSTLRETVITWLAGVWGTVKNRKNDSER